MTLLFRFLNWGVVQEVKKSLFMNFICHKRWDRIRMDRIPCFLQVKQTLPVTNSQNTWKWMAKEDYTFFPFQGSRPNFQVRTVSFREGTAISPDFLSLGGHEKTSETFQERWPSSIEELLGEDGWCDDFFWQNLKPWEPTWNLHFQGFL